MALPFLQAEEIPEMYTRLEGIPESQKLQDLMQYVCRTWITSTENMATVNMERLHEVNREF